MLTNELITLLRELNSSSPDIEASAVISTEGLVIAAALPEKLDEDRVGAMTAALLARAKKMILAIDNGELQQLFLIAKNGGVLMLYTNSGALLVVLVKPDAKAGLVFFTIEQLLERIVMEIKKITFYD